MVFKVELTREVTMRGGISIGFVKSIVSEDLCSGSKRRGFDEFVGLVRYLSWEFILKRPDNYSILYGYGANGKFH